MAKYALILLFFSLSGSLLAQTFENQYNAKIAIGFSDEDLQKLYEAWVEEGRSDLDKSYLETAILSPYIPKEGHAGERFLEAVSWYQDILIGSNDGQFTLSELAGRLQEEKEVYLDSLEANRHPSYLAHSYKWLQKLTILKVAILEAGDTAYAYDMATLSRVRFDSEWNQLYTILDSEDFLERVVAGSYDRPVLVKFGLTYCVHCLLMENLGSVPAVHRRYKDKIDVYKLWWNPKDAAYDNLNKVAQSQGVTSSPYFILYKDGKIINAGYAFPDETGSGLSDFLAPVLD